MPRTYVRGNTQILAGSITNIEINANAGIELAKLVDGTDLVVAGTAASQAIDAGGFKITNGSAGTDPTDLVTKAQLDSVSAGLDPKESCRAATTDHSVRSGLLTIDTVTLVDGDRVLVKDQTAASENGIFIANAASWARATDFNGPDNVTGGAYSFVEAGSQAGLGYVIVADGTVDIGTDAVVWTEFTAGQVYTAGDAIAIASNVISVKVDDTSIEISSDTLSVKALGIATGMLQDDAVDRTKLGPDCAGNGLVVDTGGSAGALAVSVDASSLEISANTVRVKNDGIRDHHLNVDCAGDGMKQDVNGALAISLLGEATLAGGLQLTGGDLRAVAANTTINISNTGIKVNTNGITPTEINTSVAGTGLTGGGGSALAIDDTAVHTFAKYVVSQAPAETPNDSLQIFTWNGGNPIVSGTEMIFLNGQLLERGGNDYTIVASTGVATFTFAPATDDKLRATFFDV